MAFSSDQLDNDSFLKNIVKENSRLIMDSASVKDGFKSKQANLNHGIKSAEELRQRLKKGFDIPTGEREIAAATLSD